MMLKNGIQLLLMTLTLLWVSPVVGDDFAPGSSEGSSSSSRFSEAARFKEYERQLNAILLTRRDEEKQFIKQVVDQVRAGKIPSKLVSTSFDWVRKKRPGTKYPFIYFEKVLRLQAQQLGIAKEIPAFDFSVYRRSVGQLPSSARGNAGQSTQIRRNSFFTPGSRILR